MCTKKFLTLSEAAAVLEAMSDDDDDEEFACNFFDFVQFPPTNVDELTDLEDIDENELDEDNRKDLATEIELHIPRDDTDEDERPPKTANRNKRSRKDTSENVSYHSKFNTAIVNIRAPKWTKMQPIYSKEYHPKSHEKFHELLTSLSTKSPVEIFELIFDQNIMESIVNQSKLYAAQKNIHNFDMTTNCLRHFIGILIYSGYNSLPQEKLYWYEDEDIDRQIIQKCMARNRYFEIKRNIHFNDNSNIQPNCPDKIYKIRPLIDKLNVSFMQFGVFSDKLSIDEQMVRYYGHHFMKQFIRGKPIRFGLKQWIMACGETGYCFKMSVYQGKEQQGEPRSNEFQSLSGLGEKVVMGMIESITDPTEHEVYIDNFFTSYNLLVLLSKHGIRCTGTARYNRMGMKNSRIVLKEDHNVKNEARGFYDYLFDKQNEIIAILWKDNKAVKMLSNHQHIEPIGSVKRYNKSNKSYIDLPQPNLINQYNKYMGGVDKLDWHIPKYRINIRGKKWYFPLFTNAIEVAIYNSYVLYSKSHSKIAFLDFKRMIATDYLKRKSISNPKNMGRSSNISTSKRVSTLERRGQAILLKEPLRASNVNVLYVTKTRESNVVYAILAYISIVLSSFINNRTDNRM